MYVVGVFFRSSSVIGSAGLHTIIKRAHHLNPLFATLKPHSNGPSYSNTLIGTLAVDGWAVTFGTARRGLGGLPSPLLAVPIVTAHPSTASVPITVLHDDPLLCGFNVAIKGSILKIKRNY